MTTEKLTRNTLVDPSKYIKDLNTKTKKHLELQNY